MRRNHEVEMGLLGAADENYVLWCSVLDFDWRRPSTGCRKYSKSGTEY